MYEWTAVMDEIGRDSLKFSSQRVLRLLLVPAISLLLLGGFAALVDSSAAAPVQTATWHSFSPQGWVNTPGVESSVFLTSTAAPIQTTARYSVSLDSGSNWVGPYNATLTNPAANRWRLETTVAPFGSGQNNRVRFAVNLVGGQHAQSEAYVVKIDLSAPAIQIVAPQAGAMISAANLTFQGTATDALSGIRVVTLTVGSLALTPALVLSNWSANWPVPIEDGVQHTLIALAEDLAGNGASTSVAFTVDRVAPNNPTSITETHGVQNGAMLPSPIRLNFEWSGANDGGGIAGYRVYWGTQPNGVSTHVASTTTYTPPAMTQSGPHYLRISTRDLAGNTAPWQTAFTVTLQSATRTVFLPLVSIRPEWARYEPNNTMATAYGPLLSGHTYQAYIWPAGDQDYYFIDVASTAADITVSLANIAANADYDLYLYDSTSTLVADSAQYGNVDEFIRYRPPAPGRYVIRIYPYQGASQVQPYRLRADFP